LVAHLIVGVDGMMSRNALLESNVIVAQLRSDDHIKIRKEEDLTVIEESDSTLSGELITVLKFICKNFANYILVDNQFAQFIYNEIRKARVAQGRRSLESQIEQIAPDFEENPELTVFSVLDGEDLHGLE
jgi:hypothetical protein